jgi:hypothetical protein
MKYEDIKLSKDEKTIIEKWIKKHSLKHKDDKSTIGDRFSITFSLTSIGFIVNVHCACGEHKYIHRDL